MASEFLYQREVEFAETDMAGIVHFSNFFRYMEAAEHAFFRSLGFTLHETQDGVMHGWARVHAECDYRSPLRYQDAMQVRVRVKDLTRKAITYDFEFRKNGSSLEEDALARGSLTVLCVRKEPGSQQMSVAEMPQSIAESLDIDPAFQT